MENLTEKVKEKAKDIANQNASLARQKTRKADSLLMEARKGDRKNKELVLEALQLYNEALELNSKQIQPYIGIAYITYSSGDLKNAIAILNKAEEIDPHNEQLNEMLSAFRDEFKRSNISSAISKVAGKSLSEKLKTDDKKEFNFFGKITSIFFQTVKKKSSPNKVVAETAAVSATGAASPNVQSNQQSGNFFENIRNLSSKNK